MKGMIVIGSDHAGYQLKEKLKEHLIKSGYEIKDYGTDSEESTDYPDYAHSVANDVNNGIVRKGILVCGSANGVNMVANKYQNVRSAICWTEEIASLARLHNNANILALPARFIKEEQGVNITDVFLSTEFEGGRHERRVKKINQCI